MLNPHTSVGIAQVVFYVPALPISIFILVRNWKKGAKSAWYPLVTFCLVRLAGGILTIVRDSDPTNTDLIIAATVLLNIGVIPLLLTLIGLIRIVITSSPDANIRARYLLRLLRIIFIVAIALIIASGSLSSPGPNLPTAKHLAQVAYILFAVVVALSTVELVHLRGQEKRNPSSTAVYVNFGLLAIPFLVVRVVYGLLYEYNISNILSVWNPVFGSAVAFALMCLLTEYIVFCIYSYLGFHYMRHYRVVGNGEVLDTA